MKTEHDQWHELRAASTPALPADFAARVIEQASLRQRRTRLVRRTAAASFCLLAGVAALSLLIDFARPRDFVRRDASGRVQKVAGRMDAQQVNLSQQSGNADAVIFAPLARVMFPAIYAPDPGADAGAIPDDWDEAAACVPESEGFVCLSPTDGYFQVASN